MDGGYPMQDDRPERSKLMSLAVHELRTPVSVVAGYLRIMLRHFGDSLTETQVKLVQEAERSCGSLSRLLDELSHLSRLHAGKVEMCRRRLDLYELLKSVAADLVEGRDRGIVLELDPPPAPVPIMADADSLGPAIGTLLSATLRERAEPTTIVAACRHVATPEGRRAVVAVGAAELAGTLAGSASSDVPFDAYRGGLGFLPLIAAEVVSAHGGTVASPVPTRGRLALVVSLPAAPEDAP